MRRVLWSMRIARGTRILERHDLEDSYIPYTELYFIDLGIIEKDTEEGKIAVEVQCR